MLALVAPGAALAAEGPGDGPAAGPRHWVFASIRQDLPWTEASSPCSPASQASGELSCFRADETQYLGVPRDPSTVDGGLSPGTTRALVGYEHFVHPQVAVVGLVGVAFRGGAPRSVGSEARGFFPLHLELGGTTWPLGAPPRDGGIAPFVGASGGMQQIDAHFTLHVRESPDVPPAPSQRDNPPEQELDVHRKSGTGFVAATAGIALIPRQPLLLRIASTAAVLFPATGVSIGLEASVGIDL